MGALAKLARVTPAAALTAALTHMDGPFDWATANCCTTAYQAFQSLWDAPDMPVADYSDARSALRWMEEHGPLSRLADDLGLVATLEHPGALGAVVGKRWALALCIKPDLWAHTGRGGVLFSRGELGKVWSMPWR